MSVSPDSSGLTIIYRLNKICLSTVSEYLFFLGWEVGVRRIWDRVIGVSKSQGQVNLSRGNRA